MIASSSLFSLQNLVQLGPPHLTSVSPGEAARHTPLGQFTSTVIGQTNTLQRMTESRVLLTALFAFCFTARGCCAWTSTTTIASRRSGRIIHTRLSLVSTKWNTGPGRAGVTTKTTVRDERIQEVLKLARELGPVGIRQSAEKQIKILDAALQLQKYSDRAPAKLSLSGIHDLLYSAAPGGSSGKLGPFNGVVTQEFVDESTFVNAVQLGPVIIALTAKRTIKNDTTIEVKFYRTTVSVFGIQLVDKEIGGGGAWKMLFAGRVKDRDGTDKLVRVMQTPSLFVIEQPVALK